MNKNHGIPWQIQVIPQDSLSNILDCNGNYIGTLRSEDAQFIVACVNGYTSTAMPVENNHPYAHQESSLPVLTTWEGMKQNYERGKAQNALIVELAEALRIAHPQRHDSGCLVCRLINKVADSS